MAEGQSIIRASAAKQVDVEYWCKLYESLVGSRATFDSHWSEVARRIHPEADQFRTQREPGERRRQLVFSSHGSRALRKWVSVMLSLMVPKTSQYQRVQADDPELNKIPAVKLFFEELTRRMFRLRNSPKADFYGALAPVFSSLGAFGNGCYFIDERDDGGVRYIPIPLSQVWIAVDHYKRPVTIFHAYPMSADAAFKKWGPIWGSNPPEKVKQKLESDPWGDLQWLHVVTPRGAVDPDALGPQAMAYRSLHIGLDDKVLVTEGGYHEMPYVFARESLEANELYGRGAGMVVLPELHTLDAMKRTMLRAGERVAAPPILMHDDGFGLARRANLAPDGINPGMLDSQGRSLMQPFQTGARLDLNREMMADEAEAIDDAFGLNLFRILLEDPRSGVTATEILQRAQEKGDLIAPGINARQSQMLGPTTEREIGIMARQGGLPEVPPELLEAGGYTSEYVSPANQLQRAGELAAVARTMELIAPLGAVDPRVYLKFNAGALVDRAMDIQGGPADVLRSEDEFAELLQGMAEQEAQAQEAQQAREGAAALKDGAGALQLLQGGATGGA